MTDRNFGAGIQWFFAKVVNRKDDPLKAGRMQIRVHGVHDDESNIPDKDLPWAYCQMPPTSASLNGIGDSPTGILEGSHVMGYFVDAEKQHPVVTGTIHRSVVDKIGGK